MFENTKIRFSLAQFPILADEIFKEILMKMKLKVFLWWMEEKFVIYSRAKKQITFSIFSAASMAKRLLHHIIPMKTAEESIGQ